MVSASSAITRCPLTLAQDGRDKAVDFSLMDGLCLDGRRLVLVGQAAVGSGIEKEYRTELESFVRVVGYAASSQSDIEYFRVWRSDGFIEQYGHTQDSRIEAGAGTAFASAWRLNRREDRRGNYIDYEYVEDALNGEVYISKIEYGGNTSNQQAHLYRVVFESESRTDTILSYRQGYKFSRNSRLKSIHLLQLGLGQSAEQVFSYNLGYDYSPTTGASRLKSVSKCGLSDCVPATSITWHQAQFAFHSPSTTGMPQHSMAAEWHYTGGMFTDLDNDGWVDYLHSGAMGTLGEAAKNIFMLNQSGVFPTSTSFQSSRYLRGDASNGGLRLLDFNHDGRSDILKIVNGVISAQCGTGHGGAFGFVECTAIPAGKTAQEAYLFVAGNYSDATKDNGVRVADINGDNIDDIILLKKTDTAAFRKVYLGGYRTDIVQGQKYYYWYEHAALTAALPQDAYFVKSGKDHGLRLIDINGDGRPDLARSSPDGTKSVLLNKWAPDELDESVAPSRKTLGAIFELDTALADAIPISFVGGDGVDIGVRFADFNGDGILDIIRGYSSPDNIAVRLYFGTGTGFSANDAEYAGSIGFDVNINGREGGIRFADVNNDGLTDVVELLYVESYSGSDEYKRNVFLNTGKRFKWSQSLSESIGELYIGKYRDNWVEMHGTDVTDINGDGYADLVQLNRVKDCVGCEFPYGRGEVLRRYQAQKRADGESNDKVSAICDGRNHCFNIKYEPLTDPAVYTPAFDAELPKRNQNNSMHVVSVVDEVAGSGLSRRNEYHYKGLVTSLDGRGSLGFAEYTVSSSVSDDATGQYRLHQKVATSFSQEWPFVGMQTNVKTWAGDAQTLVSEKVNAFGLKICEGADNSCLSDASSAVQDPTKRYFPYVQSSVENNYDYATGVLLSTVSATYDLDEYGNITSQLVQATGNGQLYTDQMDTAYLPADSQNWMFSLPVSSLRRRTQLDVDGNDANDDYTTKRTFSYYSFGEGHNNGGQLKQEVIEPEDLTDTLRQTNNFTYDVFGNRTSVTGVVSGLPARASTTQYDEHGIYPIVEINALGQTTTRVFDAVHGRLKEETDPNGLIDKWSYDWLGREISRTSPDGVVTTTTYSECALDCLSDTDSIVTSTTVGQAPVVTYVDALGRVIGSRKKQLGGKYAYVQKKYGNSGELRAVSRPYYVGDNVYWTTFSYDALGRLLSEIAPNNAVTAYEYVGFDRIKTNALGLQEIEQKNVLGLPLRIIDAKGKSIYFFYDAFGKPSRTIDAKGNETRIVYDVLGRKTELRDPDLGLWTYAYNAFGELIQQTNAKGKSVSLTYDLLGRLKERSEETLANTTWTYDVGANAVGRLSSSSTSNGFLRTHTYDNYGRLSSTITRVAGVDYAMTQEYADGRVVAVRYPGDRGYRNFYNADGQLAEIKDYGSLSVLWSGYAMDAAGNITEEKFASGIGVHRGYKPDTGLLDYVRSGPLTAGRIQATVQDDYYDYDLLGNLWFRYDGVAGTTEVFSHDELNRLQTAHVDGLLPQEVAYDEIGNIVSKSGVGNYVYPVAGPNAIRPHAVSSVTGGVSSLFSYDANGNMLAGNGKSYTWTSFDKPESISAGNLTDDYLYDSEHERVQRLTSSVEGGVSTPLSRIVYLNPRLDLGGTFEREFKADGSIETTYHLYANDQVIGAMVYQGLSGTASPRFFHLDHLGSIVAITDASSAVLERLSYDAWGKRRLLNKTSTVLGGLPSVVLPPLAEDRERLIVRQSNGSLITHTNGLKATRPFARGENVPATMLHSAEAVLQTGSANESDRNFIYAVENTAGEGGAAYRRYGVVMRKTTLYEQSCAQSTCDERPLDTLKPSTQYVVRLVSNGVMAQLNVQEQGVPGALSRTVTLDWMGGLQNMQKHLVIGLAEKQKPRWLPVSGMIVRLHHHDAPVAMLALSQEQVAVQDGAVIAQSTRHGFTGHEMLDAMQLVHMNGRIYDPLLARFQSPDVAISLPGDQQAYNRYSYVMNAPLAHTDPSGFIINKQSSVLPDVPSSQDRMEGVVMQGASASVANFMSGQAAVFGEPDGFSTPKINSDSGGNLQVAGPVPPGSLAAKNREEAERAAGGMPSMHLHDDEFRPRMNAVGEVGTGVLQSAAPSGLGLVTGFAIKWFRGLWAAKAANAATVANTASFASKQAAREALDGRLGVAANRFFRDAAKNAQDFRISNLADGAKRFEFFSPARNAGYGKQYVQEVDSTGSIIREFKNTMGPNGLIETKWIHGGP